MTALHDTCGVCGNPVKIHVAICPYCEAVERADLVRIHLSTVDIGHADLTTRQALDMLDVAVEDAAASGLRAMIIVHGYGSTGYGGGIRKAVHAACRNWQSVGRIRYWLSGERLRPGEELADALCRDVPELRHGPHWNAGNPGITVVRL